MATRRMFSKTITNSSRFLMMPQSAQNLYFHLGMNADDDGFCEHFTVMRMTDSKPDDLRVLQARGFVKIFDDKVLVILDWKENNYIRKDRYTPSKYLEIYKEEIKRLSSGIPMGNQRDTQDSLGKDSLDKDRIGKNSIKRENKDKNNTSPTDKAGAFNENTGAEVKTGKKRIYSEDSIEYKLSALLLKLILERYPRFKQPDLQKWALHIDRLIRLDKHPPDEIEKVIRWCQQDAFWQNNILSTEKLRKQYDQLALKSGIGKVTYAK